MPSKPPAARVHCRRTEHEGRRSSSARGYDRHHRKWRAQVLAAQPLCVECQKRALIKPATVADHIQPVAVAPHRRLDVTNGRGLCDRCHAIITDHYKRTGVNEMPDQEQALQ